MEPIPPRDRDSPRGTIGPAGFIVFGAGIVLVAIGQYSWSAGHRPLGSVLVTSGGVLVAAVLVRAAWVGLPGRRRP